MSNLIRFAALVAGSFAALALASVPASAKPPLEAFGDVPEIRAMELSPDGSKVAFLQRRDNADLLVIHDFASGASKALVQVTDIRARTLEFVGDDYVVLIASKDTRTFGFRGRYEFSAAFAFNLKTGSYSQLLRNTDGIFPAQSGLGRIVAADPANQQVYMPAFMGSAGYKDPSLDLMRVPLESGRGLRTGSSKGTSNTIDWLARPSGEALAREDFNEKEGLHEIRTHTPAGGWQTVYSERGTLPKINLVGVSPDGTSLIVVDARDSEFMSLYGMSLADGTISPPLMQREDAEVTAVVSDSNRVVYGVRYSGMFPSYEMFDSSLNADIKTVQNSLGAAAVYLDSWSDDWSKILFYVEGGSHAERYILFDRAKKSFTNVGEARPGIKQADVGEVVTIEYKARDDLKIPGLITWPAGVPETARKNLPLVVMPHGGPEAYDSVGFDWLAQFLANEGYMVFQPNFRGSAGFGNAFRVAGRGQWGRQMQDDITDGVNALIRMGWANKERVCIVGWSYGGYAALAGGALTPDLYKCVVSVAGVSNLREMIATEKRNHGAQSIGVLYWEMLIGDPDQDREAIDAVSPSKLADKFRAPVLLIHGADDTTVPAKQSDMMNEALKTANKQVDYIRIKGDDHGLVDNDSRRQALTELSAFLKTHIGK